MIAVTDELLRQMVQAIVGEVAPEAIYLFGSRARGEAGPESDVDLLIVEREPFGPQRPRLAEMARIRRALSAFRVPKDILAFSMDEVAYWQDSLNHITSRCRREGRVLYVRS
jgi:predicted nucleotidyltransferase